MGASSSGNEGGNEGGSADRAPAAREVEPRTQRLVHYRNVAEHTLNDRPIIYLYHAKLLYAATTKLSGFTPYPDGLIRPQGLRLD